MLNNEYKCRLKKHTISTDLKLIPEELWMDDVTKWPELDDGKLFGYILQVKAVETEYIGVYKDQKAYSYWMSSFVGPVWYSVCPSDKNIVFLKSEVCPSQRIHDDTYKVWVCFKRDKKGFSICTSWCTCIAGSGKACNYVIAVLYKVNYAFKKDFTSPACTSIPQDWNKGTRKKVQPTRVCNTMFRKDKKTKKGSNSLPDNDDDDTLQKDFDPRHHLQRELTNERVSLLFSGLRKAAPDACVHTQFVLKVMLTCLLMLWKLPLNLCLLKTGPISLLRRLVLYFWRACNSTQHKEIWWKNALEANSQMMSWLHKDVGVLLFTQGSTALSKGEVRRKYITLH